MTTVFLVHLSEMTLVVSKEGNPLQKCEKTSYTFYIFSLEKEDLIATGMIKK